MRLGLSIDSITVGQLGQAIVNTAAEEQSSTNSLALDNFHTTLTSSITELPQTLNADLTTFNTNFYKYYTDVLTQRGDIGKVLLNTATAADKTEVQTVNLFTDVPPQVMA
ncbi:MAG: hypothetical protein ACRDHZ_22555 [Ktedonobacteraceae bacterium]